MIDPEDLEILTGGVEDLDHAVIAEEVEQRIEREPFDEGIDDHRVILTVAGIGELDEAELGVVGAFAQKFGIDRQIGMCPRGVAECGEVLCRRDRLHVRSGSLS